MKKFHIHYSYGKNYVYSTLGLNHFKNKIIKTFTRNLRQEKETFCQREGFGLMITKSTQRL